MEWFEANGWVGWLALALALAAIEAATVDFLFIMLAGGALAGSLAAAFGLPFFAQVIVAAVVAVALIGVVRPMLTRRYRVPLVPLGVDARIGAPAVVLDTVSVHGGRIKLSGEEWSARLATDGASLPAGSTVYVQAVRGATAIVDPSPAMPATAGPYGEPGAAGSTVTSS